MGALLPTARRFWPSVPPCLNRTSGSARRGRKNCCSRWYGVSCDPTTGRVADITLRGESEDPILARAGHSGGLMSGRISPEICRLDRLTTLILADWKQISGPIPLHHLLPSSASSTSLATASGSLPPTLAASPPHRPQRR
ncbi:DNA-damage-repair toleration protein [Musa troglodytarum]|uniref:DNA-damage-repair toleration protein n=1 Tax=Musa troglodytarum TaxID=320322 RepID=A0A9E7I995_9LILI|nr:DNA-damage-repair toleration protein [Musa troglodytarum]